MNFPKEFFHINLRFAQKVSEISQEPIENALLNYTNLYIRFGVGRDFDATNPIWQEYLEGLHQAQGATEWTYHFYLKQQQQNIAKLKESPFGCFSYTMVSGDRIRLHFHNNEPSEFSPLSRDRMGKRFVELQSMFAQIKHDVDNATNVIGASWLYNLEAYCRLFPPMYLATAQVSVKEFPFLPLWGQFIDHHGCAKENLISYFLERINEQHNLDDLAECFPFQVLYLESPIQEFFQFYKV